MANPVVVGDLEARWRALSATESAAAQAFLADAWALLLSRVPGLADNVTAGNISTDLVVAIETAMVLRVMRNPEGKRSESIDDYSWTIDNSRSGGALYVSDDELALFLPVRAKAKSVTMGTYTPPYPDPNVDDYTHSYVH